MLTTGTANSFWYWVTTHHNSYKPLQVDEALGVFREMVSRGCDRNTVTYAALIAACERAGRPQAARELFAEMQREGVKPNVSTYNAVIGACAQSESQPDLHVLNTLLRRTSDPQS